MPIYMPIHMPIGSRLPCGRLVHRCVFSMGIQVTDMPTSSHHADKGWHAHTKKLLEARI